LNQGATLCQDICIFVLSPNTTIDPVDSVDQQELQSYSYWTIYSGTGQGQKEPHGGGAPHIVSIHNSFDYMCTQRVHSPAVAKRWTHLPFK
jgi:hypothetical protein